MVSRERAIQEDRFKAWPDSRLVRECLKGNQEAWSALVDKYKNLIFSIPIKYGFSADDATDIFQSVCLELLSQLPKLRNPQALPKWIMQVTAHKCFHGKRQQQRTEVSDPNDPKFEQSTPSRAESILREAENEQCLRQIAIGIAGPVPATRSACYFLKSLHAPIKKWRER